MVKAEFYHNERHRQQQHPRHKTQSHPRKHTHKTHSAFVNVTGFFCVKTKRIKRVLLVFVLRYERKRDSKCLHLVATTTNFRGVLDAVHVCIYISVCVCVLREYRFACVRVQVHTLVCVYVYTPSPREYINFFPFSNSQCVCMCKCLHECVCVRGNVVKNSKNLAQARMGRGQKQDE